MCGCEGEVHPSRVQVQEFGASFACFWAVALKFVESFVEEKKTKKNHKKRDCLSPTCHNGKLVDCCMFNPNIFDQI